MALIIEGLTGEVPEPVLVQCFYNPTSSCSKTQDGISIVSTFNGAAFGTPAQHAAGQIGQIRVTFFLEHYHRLRRACA